MSRNLIMDDATDRDLPEDYECSYEDNDPGFGCIYNAQKKAWEQTNNCERMKEKRKKERKKTQI